MKPPVDHVRVSTKGKDILLKIKRNTGLEHWNEICRIALCKSLSNLTPPRKFEKLGDSSIEIDWKTFAGPYREEFTALIRYRADKDKIDISSKEAISDYFRNHLERGISSIQNVKNINRILLCP